MALPLPAHITTRIIPSRGTGLFTTKSIQAGEMVFKNERPLITVLDSARLRSCCEWCLTTGHEGGDMDHGDGGVKLRACTGCGVVRYCSKVGQGFFFKVSVVVQFQSSRLLNSSNFALISVILLFTLTSKSRERQFPAPRSVSLYRNSTTTSREEWYTL